MKITIRGLLLAAVLGALVSNAQAITLVDYELNGAQWDATDVPLNVSASVADVFGSAFPSFSANGATENWPLTGKSLTDYIGFSVSADAGNILTLDQLQFVAWRGNGPASGEMSYSFDGYSTVAGSQFFSLGSNSATAISNPKTFSLGSVTTDQVEFRIYFYDADTEAGRLFIRGSTETVGEVAGIFALTGSVDALPVPEPNGFLLVCGMAFCALRKRGRRAHV